MALQVPPQVVQTGVGLGAELAVVGSHSRVVQRVLLQHAAVREGLAALVAHVGPLARVHAHVDRDLVRHRETFPAHGALERPLSRVGEPVRAHRPHLGEGLAAIGAHVRLLARVHPGVTPQPPRGGEALRTVRALVRPLARVSAHVLFQVVAVAEAPAADRAALGPLVVVAQLVVGQAFLGQEALAALLTLVGLVVVHPLVVLQLADARERLIAVAAAETVVGAVGKLVLAHLVVPQQVGHLEGLPAVGTLVFAQQLDALMSDPLVQGPEVTAAPGANVGGVLTLPLPVARQVGLGAEGFAALRALVRLHRRVEPLMLQKLEAILKAPPAQRTVVRDPPPRVQRFDRRLPGRRRRRGGAMGRADLGAFASAQQLGAPHLATLVVPQLMFGQTLGGDKALPAALACVRFVVIHLLVILQVSDP